MLASTAQNAAMAARLARMLPEILRLIVFLPIMQLLFDFLAGSLPAATGRKMHFTGTTVLRLKNGKIIEEIGLDDGVRALQQLGFMNMPRQP